MGERERTSVKRFRGLFICSLMVAFFLTLPDARDEGRQPLRLLLPPFWGSSTDPAHGVGLSDLFRWCLDRLSRVQVVSGKEVMQAITREGGMAPLKIEEAAELTRRLEAQAVLVVRSTFQEGRLTYHGAVGDLRGQLRWVHLPVEERPWSEGFELHIVLSRELLKALRYPVTPPEERRVLAACSRPFPSPQALSLYGQARLQEWLGEGEEAAAIYLRAAEAAPRFALPFLRQGELFEAMGSRWKAAGAYRRAIQAGDRFPEAYKQLGDLLAKSPRHLYEQAVDAYQKAVEIDADYAEAYVGLADSFALLGRTEEAIGGYQRGLQADPWNPRAHFGLAKIYDADKGLFHEAVAEYQRALALDPGFVEAHLGLGDLLEEKGLYREAAARYQAVLRLKPKHPGALFALARASEKVDISEAMARWEEYLSVASELLTEREWLDIAKGHLEKLKRQLDDPKSKE
jgi:tetratricopeptide (TPR) repeat protein